jgi:twitching motility protein PilU
VPINNQALPFDAPRSLLAEMVPPERMAELDAESELNMGFPIAGLGRFRVSAMRQRGSIAAVIRFITVDVPHWQTCRSCRHSGRPDHGKAWAVADGRRHRRWQEHHAGVHDRSPQRHVSGHILTIEDPVEFLFKNKKSRHEPA